MRKLQPGSSEIQRKFEELLREEKDRIYGVVYRLVGPDAAEDVAQEVFLRAFRSLGEFRSEARLTTWLYRIAINSCRDYHRRKSRRKWSVYSIDGGTSGSLGEQVERQIPDERPGPLEVVETNYRRECLLDALAKLPPKHREVVILHDVEGLRYDEISEIVQCPLGTVKSRLYYARRKLRETLEKAGFGG